MSTDIIDGTAASAVGDSEEAAFALRFVEKQQGSSNPVHIFHDKLDKLKKKKKKKKLDVWP